MKELIEAISLFDRKTATTVRKVVRIAKAIDKATNQSNPKKK